MLLLLVLQGKALALFGRGRDAAAGLDRTQLIDLLRARTRIRYVPGAPTVFPPGAVTGSLDDPESKGEGKKEKARLFKMAVWRIRGPDALQLHLVTSCRPRSLQKRSPSKPGAL